MNVPAWWVLVALIAGFVIGLSLGVLVGLVAADERAEERRAVADSARRWGAC